MKSGSLAAICGDYCAKCPNYPAECQGCSLEAKPECRFVVCCVNKRIEHCGQCESLPCAALAKFVPDDSEGCPPGYHIENLRRRVAVGTERWLHEQRFKWGR